MVDIVFIGRLFLGWNKNTSISGTWSIFDNSATFTLEDMFSFASKRWVILLLMIELKEWTIGKWISPEESIRFLLAVNVLR